MFQFPNLFPKFEDTRPLEIPEDTKPSGATAPTANGNASPEKGKDVKPDIKPDIKPTPAQLRGAAKKYGIKPPEGRIGSLVVMRSGRVKMVLGDGIVMNVSTLYDLSDRSGLMMLAGVARSRDYLLTTAGPLG